MNQINTVAYILIEKKKILLVKAKNKNAFYMPGGKPNIGEKLINALVREVKEELGIDLVLNSLSYYGTFEAQAYGKEKGMKVCIECYVGKHKNKPSALAEIEEVCYFTSNEYLLMPETASAVRLIVKDLKRKGLID